MKATNLLVLHRLMVFITLLFSCTMLNAQTGIKIKQRVEIVPKRMHTDSLFTKTSGISKKVQATNFLSNIFPVYKGSYIIVDVLSKSSSAAIDVVMRQPTAMTLISNALGGEEWISSTYTQDCELQIGIHWLFGDETGDESGVLISQIDVNTYVLSFEDIGTDWDYNDLVVQVTIYSKPDHFDVTSSQDTIQYNSNTSVRVIAKDQYNNPSNYPSDAQILITATPTGYGTLYIGQPSLPASVSPPSPDSLVLHTPKQKGIAGVKKLKTVSATGDASLTTTYSQANSYLFFVADGTEPKENQTVTFTASCPDDPSVTAGTKNVVIVSNIELVVDYPTDNLNEHNDIDKTPYMPDIIPKAHLKNYTGGTVNFQWNLRVQWESPGGRPFDDSFPGNTQVSNSDVSSWVINWREITRGGDEITLDVTASTGKNVYNKTVNHGFIIGGLNPSKDEVKNGLSIEEQVIVYMESKPKWKQFYEDINRFPIWGTPRGYGLWQLDTPPASDEQVWNWRENTAAGQALFGIKKSLATAYPSVIRKKGGFNRFASDYTQQELLTDAFQLYNGHHYWIWVTNKWLPFTGFWEKNPNLTRDYGGAAIKIYNTVQSGGTPDGW